jgi:hypothetical protein
MASNDGKGESSLDALERALNEAASDMASLSEPPAARIDFRACLMLTTLRTQTRRRRRNDPRTPT